MRSTIIYLFEMIIGAIVLVLGLFYLVSQVKAMNRLTDIVSNEIMENRDLYQQSNDISIDKVSDEELYATIMGYREYPIIIDGNLIDTEGTDYEVYSSYIKDDYYRKSYEYDSKHFIRQIVFIPFGT